MGMGQPADFRHKNTSDTDEVTMQYGGKSSDGVSDKDDSID